MNINYTCYHCATSCTSEKDIDGHEFDNDLNDDFVDYIVECPNCHSKILIKIDVRADPYYE